ncbi:MAG: MlaD family protein [Brevinematales bacterium]|nr:MlaD family protein [Brevinematales bacterium]
MPFTFKSAQKAVAVFIFLGLFFLLTVTILILRGSDVLQQKVRYYTILNEAYGLTSGMPVKYKGITVGKIKKLALTPDRKVSLDFYILKEYKELIQENTVLKVQSSLLGAASLILVLPQVDSQLLPPESLVLSMDMPKGQEVLQLVAQQQPSKDDLTAKVKDVLDGVLELKPTIQGILLNLQSTTGELNLIVRGLRTGESTVTSDRVLASLANLETITKNLKEITTLLRSENNTVGALLQDKKQLYTRLESILASVDKSLQSLSVVSGKLEGTPDDVKQLTSLLKDNLIELRSVLQSLRNLLGSSSSSPSLKQGERK